MEIETGYISGIIVFDPVYAKGLGIFGCIHNGLHNLLVIDVAGKETGMQEKPVIS